MDMRAFKKAVLIGIAFACGASQAGDLFEPSDRIANEGTIGDKWMLAEGAKLAVPAYPANFAPRGANVCIGLGYRIAENGVTSNFAVLRQWNSESGEKEPVEGFWKAFAEAGADAVGQWRFKPRPGMSPRATYTMATLTFAGKGVADPALGSHCRVEDLAGVVQERKARMARQSRETHDLERADHAAQSRSTMNERPGRPH